MSYPYITQRKDGRYWKLHQLVWMEAYGPIPEGYVVDHINGDTTDNRIENLRLATTAQNGFNAKLSKRNTSGVKGLCWSTARSVWVCQIRSDDHGKVSFRTTCKLEAVAWLYRTRLELHGEFARFI